MSDSRPSEALRRWLKTWSQAPNWTHYGWEEVAGEIDAYVAEHYVPRGALMDALLEAAAQGESYGGDEALAALRRLEGHGIEDQPAEPEDDRPRYTGPPPDGYELTDALAFQVVNKALGELDAKVDKLAYALGPIDTADQSVDDRLRWLWTQMDALLRASHDARIEGHDLQLREIRETYREVDAVIRRHAEELGRLSGQIDEIRELHAAGSRAEANVRQLGNEIQGLRHRLQALDGGPGSLEDLEPVEAEV